MQRRMGIHRLWAAALILSVLGGCQRPPSLWTFADFPGFKRQTCMPASHWSLDTTGRRLLQKFRPRIVLAPGASWPIDFYRDYLPNTVLRDADQGGRVVAEHVTREVLVARQEARHIYLDLVRTPDLRSEDRRPVIYGRIYREQVSFSDGHRQPEVRRLTFLKYNVVFARSGLPAGLSWVYDTGLRLLGLNPDDWHELDNFCAVHVVLDETEEPLAVILAQHNHHRTYLVGQDIPLPADQRMLFAVAQRSNEIYPDRGETHVVFHRTIPWSLYTAYLLSGQGGPWFTAEDITYGKRAGGEELDYELRFLDPCDPFYTSRCMLGEYRPYFSVDLGRNGPPGADYYALPGLLPLGNLLKASYLHDGNEEDIQIVRAAIDPQQKRYDIAQLIRYGERKLYHDLRSVQVRQRNPQ